MHRADFEVRQGGDGIKKIKEKRGVKSKECSGVRQPSSYPHVSGGKVGQAVPSSWLVTSVTEVSFTDLTSQRVNQSVSQ